MARLPIDAYPSQIAAATPEERADWQRRFDAKWAGDWTDLHKTEEQKLRDAMKDDAFDLRTHPETGDLA